MTKVVGETGEGAGASAEDAFAAVGGGASAGPSGVDPPGSGAPPPDEAVSFRRLGASALEHFLGADGYASVRNRNWTFVGLAAPVLGLVSDVLQIFGPVAHYLLLASAMAFVVLALLVVLRTRYCRQCAVPCVVVALLVVVFAAVGGVQKLSAAEDTGVIAKTVPGVAELQEGLVAIAERLGVVEKKLVDVAETVERTEEKIDAQRETLEQILAEMRSSSTDKAALLAEIEALRRSGDIRDQAIVTFLKDVGETPMSADQYPEQLRRFVERYRALLAEVEKPRNLPPEFEGVRRQAVERIGAGALDEADRMLAALSADMAAWRAGQQAMLDEAKRDEAIVLADRAGIAMTRLRYREAADLFDQAADLVAFDLPLAWVFTTEQAWALYAQGDEFGDNAALVEAIEAYENALTLVPRDAQPFDWALTQNDHGMALAVLGGREGGVGAARRGGCRL